MGAVRGAVAGLLYGVALGIGLLVQDWYDARHGKVAPTSWDDLPLALGVGLALFGGFAAPVGAVAGALMGWALLPVSRRLPPLRAAVVCGTATAVLGTLAFPFVPLGHLAEDRSSFLLLSVLPGVLGGLAAAWHAGAMSRIARA